VDNPDVGLTEPTVDGATDHTVDADGPLSFIAIHCPLHTEEEPVIAGGFGFTVKMIAELIQP